MATSTAEAFLGMGGQLAATILDEATKDDEGEGDTIDVVELVSVDGD